MNSNQINDYSRYDAVLDPATKRFCATAANIARALGINAATVSRNFTAARRYGKYKQYLDIDDVVSTPPPSRGRPSNHSIENRNLKIA